MIGFLFKKWFYDLWDNLLRIGLLNLGFYLSLTVPLLLPAALTFSPPLALAAMILGIFCSGVYLAAAARCTGRISDYGSFGFAAFFGNLRPALPAGLILGGAAILGFACLDMFIPFFGSLEMKPGVFIAATLFWITIAGILVFQFYPAASHRLDAKALPAVKRCFFFFLDNSPFCVFSFFAAVLMLILSVLGGFLVPGPAGVLLFHDEALRLRTLKYTWLADNPGVKSRQIPWDALLQEDREKTGSRSFRNILFPWKDQASPPGGD